jgi:copper(I)-binding protein
MELKAPADTALVAVASPSAAVVEIHEMKMDGTMMTMRAVDKVVLPAGKTVAFKAGGYHVMLMELAKPLKEGDSVPLKLHVRGQDRQQGDAGCECAGQSADRGRRGAGEALRLAAPYCCKAAKFSR